MEKRWSRNISRSEKPSKIPSFRSRSNMLFIETANRSGHRRPNRFGVKRYRPLVPRNNVQHGSERPDTPHSATAPTPICCRVKQRMEKRLLTFCRARRALSQPGLWTNGKLKPPIPIILLSYFVVSHAGHHPHASTGSRLGLMHGNDK